MPGSCFYISLICNCPHVNDGLVPGACGKCISYEVDLALARFDGALLVLHNGYKAGLKHCITYCLDSSDSTSYHQTLGKRERGKKGGSFLRLQKHTFKSERPVSCVDGLAVSVTGYGLKYKV